MKTNLKRSLLLSTCLLSGMALSVISTAAAVVVVILELGYVTVNSVIKQEDAARWPQQASPQDIFTTPLVNACGIGVQAVAALTLVSFVLRFNTLIPRTARDRNPVLPKAAMSMDARVMEPKRLGIVLTALALCWLPSFSFGDPNSLIPSLSKSKLFKEFSYTAEVTFTRTAKFYTDRDLAVPASAGASQTFKYRLQVKDDMARLTGVLSPEPSDLPEYTTISHGAASIEYYVKSKEPDGKLLMRAVEDGKHPVGIGIWKIFDRDDSTLAYWWEVANPNRKITASNNEIIVQDDSNNLSITFKYTNDNPPLFMSYQHSNTSGKAKAFFEVKERYSDSFPKTIEETHETLGIVDTQSTTTITEHEIGSVSPDLFKVTPAAGSFISSQDTGWIYQVNPDGSRSKFQQMGAPKPVQTTDYAPFVIVALIGITIFGVLALLLKRFGSK